MFRINFLNFGKTILIMAFDRNTMLENCKKWCENTLMQTLEIEFIDAGEGYLKAG